MQKIFLVVTSLCCLACSKNVDTSPSLTNVDETFQQLLEEAVYASHDDVPGTSMTVIVPSLDIHWTGAAGFDSYTKDEVLQPDQPFRIASLTKTFVATAILRLHEMGKVDLDDPINKYISRKHIALLKEGGYDASKISLRHCLNHTSGLYDYAVGGRTYAETIINNPKRQWSRTDQLLLAMQSGKPIGSPGQKYRYSDTGYILVGEVIEQVMDSTLAFGLRNLLRFDKLGLQSTWLETLEKQPDGLPSNVHRYFGRNDATQWDASIDLYGGGGLVSTTADLAVFLHALFNSQIFQNEQTSKLMLEKPTYGNNYIPGKDSQFKDYRLGLWEVEIYGEKAYMHGGLWGTMFIHVPAYNCSIAINHTAGSWDRLVKKTILVIKNLKQQGSKAL